MCLPTLASVTQPSICCLLMVTCPPHRCPAGSPVSLLRAGHAPTPPRSQAGRQLEVCLHHPPPLRVFSAQGAPFSTLSPRHQLPSLGPWDLPSFDHSAVPHCLPARSSFLHLEVGSLPSCLLPMPWLSQFPSPEGSPLALCRYEFRHDRRLSSRHHLPLLPTIQRPSQGTLRPAFSFPRGAPGARLGLAGPCWVTPGSSLVASVGGRDLPPGG